MQEPARRGGFTYIELIIIVTIMGLVLVSLPNFYLQQALAQLRAAATEVRLTIEEAQSKAQSNAVGSACTGDEVAAYQAYSGNAFIATTCEADVTTLTITSDCDDDPDPFNDPILVSVPLTQHYEAASVTPVTISFTRRTGRATATTDVCVHSSAVGLSKPNIRIQVLDTGEIREYETSATCP